MFKVDASDVLISPPKTVDVSDSTRSEVTIVDLQPESFYQFQVSAYTRKGEGERTKARRIKTKGAGRL